MKRNSILLGTAAAILLAPGVLSNVSQQNVDAAALVGTIKRGGGTLYDANGNSILRTLDNFTSWKLGATKSINGVTYYKVATNEYVSASGIQIEGQSAPSATITKTPGYIGTIHKGGALSYDDNGNMTDNSFGNYTSWKLDASKVVNGLTYYRVATNQWILAGDMDVADSTGHAVNNTTSTNTVSASGITKTTGYIGTVGYNNGAYGTTACDDNGNSIGLFYVNNTSWKLTGMKLFNGQAYYRIATNQWLLGSAMSIKDASGNSVGNLSTPVPNSTGIVSMFAAVYNSNGVPTGYVLPQATEWKLGAVVTMNGKQFYKVATDEYVLTTAVKTITATDSGSVLYSGQSLNDHATLYNTESNTLTTDKNPQGTIYNILAIVENSKGKYWFKISPNTWINGLGFMDDSVYEYTTQEPTFAINAIDNTTTTTPTPTDQVKVGTVTNGSTQFFDESTGKYETSGVAEGTSWRVYTIARNNLGEYFFKVGSKEWLNGSHLSLNFNLDNEKIISKPDFGL
ncbi:SLAP domain-containing protein [Companilactobacillus allii]|uniref:S-layer protein C-terminal domain-containing protein n=1 Tax=Companilactobacillus allii TaxID=1847728 RepID=A0A1P8Q297_9LACO|nr:SLAP domain-containing protein [Companilactobacillus allii]APX71909.1 hypothetical protein BTM29_04770 [Companilactobacillus allii]USQ69002.1 SLAP domain-containing protein [Companilactobacillus allii]